MPSAAASPSPSPAPASSLLSAPAASSPSDARPADGRRARTTAAVLPSAAATRRRWRRDEAKAFGSRKKGPREAEVADRQTASQTGGQPRVRHDGRRWSLVALCPMTGTGDGAALPVGSTWRRRAWAGERGRGYRSPPQPRQPLPPHLPHKHCRRQQLVQCRGWRSGRKSRHVTGRSVLDRSAAAAASWPAKYSLRTFSPHTILLSFLALELGLQLADPEDGGGSERPPETAAARQRGPGRGGRRGAAGGLVLRSELAVEVAERPSAGLHRRPMPQPLAGTLDPLSTAVPWRLRGSPAPTKL